MTTSAATTTTSADLWDLLGTLRSRLTFRFSATGRTAAALSSVGDGTLHCEYWRLGPEVLDCAPLPNYQLRASNTATDDVPFDAAPFDDGSVLIVGGREVVFAGPGGVRTVGQLPFRPAIVAAAPDGTARVLFLGREHDDTDGACSAWLWPGPGEPVRSLGLTPPLLLRGGGWLDATGSRYVVNRKDGSRTRPGVLDTTTGECVPLPLTPAGESDVAWFTAPATGDILLASGMGEASRLRLVRPGTSATELARGHDAGGPVTPLAIRPDGRQVAVAIQRGLRNDLAILDIATDTVVPLSFSPDRTIGAACWAGSGAGPATLWSLSVGAGFPAELVGYTGDGWVTVDDGTAAGRYEHWAPSHLESFPGAGGDIEAIVCGHENWRTADRVVLALHGGPASRWSYKFSPLFQLFAAEGITVIAPNPSGSIGYGDEFQRRIVGAWAGPDLADVREIARHVSRARGGDKAALYGVSYGAFLALLAACVEPALWSRVLAVAPMLSGERLYPHASAEVRAMIDRLGGRTCLVDALGPRDVLAQLPKLTAPLMVVHGERDTTIPVTQSRKLVTRLAELGRTPGDDFHFIEVSGGGHSPLDGSAQFHLSAARFLAHARRD